MVDFALEGTSVKLGSVRWYKASSFLDPDTYSLIASVEALDSDNTGEQFHYVDFDRTIGFKDFSIFDLEQIVWQLEHWPFDYNGLNGAVDVIPQKASNAVVSDDISNPPRLINDTNVEMKSSEADSNSLLSQESLNISVEALATTIGGAFFDQDGIPFIFTLSKSDNDSGDIDPAVKTWIIIHGLNSSTESENNVFQELADVIRTLPPSDQVLLLDWTAAADAAELGSWEFPSPDVGNVEARIPYLASKAASVLTDYGFDPSNINLIGASFGAYVAAEIADTLGGVNSIVALDPARDIPDWVGNGDTYNPNEDADFGNAADFSWALYSRDGSFPEGGLGFNFAGNANVAATATEAFVVEGSTHSKIPVLFTNILGPANGGNLVSPFFQLDRLLNGIFGPWILDQFDSGGTSNAGNYEAVITTIPPVNSDIPYNIFFDWSEIGVRGNSFIISDGALTPTIADGTDFGLASLGATVEQTFRVSNSGNATLTISNFNLPPGFTLVEPLSTSIPANGFDTFTVRLNTSTTGTNSGQITFNTNDPNENPFNFQIQGNVNATPVPEISVLGTSTLVADGDATPSVSEGTNFGTVSLGTTIDHTFTVINSGNATLTTSNLILPSGFDLVESLSASIPAGGVDSFTVRLNTATAGTKEGWLVFITNDANENPYNFYITGTVNASSSLPDIAVSWGGMNIADGDTMPSDSEGTDFGTVFEGGSEARAFRVTNSGDAPLTISNVSLPDGFSIVEDLSFSIAPGSFDYFTVELDTTAVGTKSGEIQIFTNDPNENPYNFQITGTVNPASEIPTFHVAATPADMAEGSSGGLTPITFTITRTGDMSTREGVSWQGAFPVPNVPVATGDDFAEGSFPSGFMWFEVGEDTHTITIYIVADTISEPDEFFDIRLSFPTLGSVIGTERATFRVIDDDTPEIAVYFSGTAVFDDDATPSSDEGSDFGSVEQGVSAVQRTFTVENVGSSTLTFGAVNPPLGFSLIEGLSTSIAPGASDTFTVQLNTETPGTFTGNVSFGTNDSDENPFNFQITGVVTPPPPPPLAEIAVSGGEDILDGDTTPSLSDFTNFGSVAQDDPVIQRTFTVRNLGGSILTLGAISLPAGFTLIEGLSPTIAAGTFDTFTIQFNTSDAGAYAGDISFSTNDSDENPFSFSIMGVVISTPAPAIFTEGPDIVVFDEAAIAAHALGGDDSVTGSSAADSIFGDSGSDTLIGRGGDDSISGGTSGDLLRGDEGNDTLDGGGGADTLFGGADDDLLIGGLGADELRGEAGNDTIIGGGGKDTLIGREGADSLLGGLGDDRLFGGDGNDTLDGGARNDFRVSGQNGDDLLFGGIGIDNLFGGLDNDTLDAGGGDDRGVGGAGDDSILGGAGNDSVTGGDGDDTVDGGNGVDTVIGGAGADSLIGGAGEDSLTGGDGNDTLEGGNRDDTLKGQNDNDLLDGGNGNDELFGGGGDDTLDGGNGDDTLNGNAGNDIFIFEIGDDADVINGFKAGAGTDDVIDLSAMGVAFDTFAEVQAAATDDGFGNTVIDFGGGDTITLTGVATADLHQDDFVFI
jgi:Ca2+-binding RTX toxin-like protein